MIALLVMTYDPVITVRELDFGFMQLTDYRIKTE